MAESGRFPFSFPTIHATLFPVWLEESHFVHLAAPHAFAQESYFVGSRQAQAFSVALTISLIIALREMRRKRHHSSWFGACDVCVGVKYLHGWRRHWEPRFVFTSESLNQPKFTAEQCPSPAKPHVVFFVISQLHYSIFASSSASSFPLQLHGETCVSFPDERHEIICWVYRLLTWPTAVFSCSFLVRFRF